MLGLTLRTLREAAGLKQAQLAKMIHVSTPASAVWRRRMGLRSAVRSRRWRRR
ncbi:helix-turn-helix domain-containing protein [Streptomyces sp. C8S0]|uniref:helix-turn-helix domain-containing protein n=1 Tax=Streptomyces sp. C8S0 TaxID=2585716 RepID=UPI00125E210D